MDGLKYCPFCGGNQIKVILGHDKFSGRCWYVQCARCYAKSASITERLEGIQEKDDFEQIEAAVEKAKAAWNKRA